MKNKRKLTPWLYSMPALILIGMVIVFPIIYTGYISLTNMNLFHWSNYEFIGLSNYSRALLKADSGFLGALFTTLLWTTLNMVIQVVVAYFIALGFQREDLKGKRVYKTLLMFPWAMPAYVSILLWRVGIYNTEFGLLNKILVALGFGKYYTVKSRRIKFCFSAYFIRRLLFSVFYNFIFTFASNSIL